MTRKRHEQGSGSGQNDQAIGERIGRIAATFAAGRSPCSCPIRDLADGPPWHRPGCPWATYTAFSVQRVDR